ncbi:hypothetical protein N781_15020 [Pontibacillus halophilus JSM 076056 = DSM 19796]|uniref:TVP38/TMEM64 family membrane protein n=1 Tax=Pontibacillus halophilus JSM 076056 = DSM 19796 TaxID=1385510 RepID=A0A0A5GKX7_9BACI|nr:TVP38/TMEM64 family protein [Pontibacillus halophilus]KGX92634.1 hypothetical protein N781_15020 [Pontibacillus halophilus JSM 076056 = DSM 19796]
MNLTDLTFQDLKRMFENDTLDDFFLDLLDQYAQLGPIPGILLPFLEAFLPFLPLFAFVLGNSLAYGLFFGFLYSWIGAAAGAFVVFLFIRRVGDWRFMKFIREHKRVRKVTAWLERHGFGPLFLLMCFPFSPSAIINVVAGLSKVSVQQFMLAVVMGKAVMIFTIAFVGHSITEFTAHPVRTLIVGICILLFWVVGKYIEQRLKVRTEEREHVRD